MHYDPLLALSLQPESPPQFQRVGLQALKAAGLQCSFVGRFYFFALQVGLMSGRGVAIDLQFHSAFRLPTN
jgi:hypothetical protein